MPPVVIRLNVPYPPIFHGHASATAADRNGFLPFLRTVRLHSSRIILHWDVETEQLVVFYWPVLNGRRIPPSEFETFRQTHQFRGPCCLCGMLTHEYTEAAVFMVTSGRLAGEYVAACARGKCKYWAFLERLYNRLGLPVSTYPVRGADRAPLGPIYNPESENEENRDPFASSVPSSPVHTPIRRQNNNPTPGSSTSNSSTAEVRRILQPSNRPAKRARVSVNASVIPTANPPPQRVPSSPFGLLMQMDSARAGGGITVEQFNGLFTKCASCAIITTQSAFRHHCCVRRRNRQCPIPSNAEVIDLTLEDSD